MTTKERCQKKLKILSKGGNKSSLESHGIYLQIFFLYANVFLTLRLGIWDSSLFKYIFNGLLKGSLTWVILCFQTEKTRLGVR